MKDSIIADLGCGTGILGIAAALCGCENVFLFDIDNDGKISMDELSLNLIQEYQKSILKFAEKKANCHDNSFFCEI